jgi:hypothetical protein
MKPLWNHEHFRSGIAQQPACNVLSKRDLRRSSRATGSLANAHATSCFDRLINVAHIRALCHGAEMCRARPLERPRRVTRTGSASMKLMCLLRLTKPSAAMMQKLVAPLAVLSPGPRLAGTPSKG